MTSFHFQIILTFLVDLPRTRLVGTLLKNKGGKVESFRVNFCVINFNVTKHVLDIVYSQTICWLTLFYAPLITVVTLLKLLVIYYLRIFYVNFVRDSIFENFYKFKKEKKITLIHRSVLRPMYHTLPLKLQPFSNTHFWLLWLFLL